MSEPSGTPWPSRVAPDSVGGWHWDLDELGDLPQARSELRARIQGRDAVEVSEQVVLSFDEMASNALRHGRAPVKACVREAPGHWLVEVQDHAATRAPAPAVGRDPALGGLGLYIIADMATEHGWWPDGETKSVWATIPRRR
ncbi:ATP-binding protein [Goekera deserti]|uniref:ATP-binding protein n=1 Tax=Goekera deserti TaxID=2497753 RepID=UPI001F41D9CA|nr:ATP-binding protein [Goekera deserti]